MPEGRFPLHVRVIAVVVLLLVVAVAVATGWGQAAHNSAASDPLAATGVQASSTSLTIRGLQADNTPLPFTDTGIIDGTPTPTPTRVAATQITLSNVNKLKQLYQVKLPEIADGVPAYLAGVHTSGGVKNILFVNTKAGRLVALDDKDGSQIWAQQAAPSPQYTTSSPVVDPNHQYVYSYGLDGKVHKYGVSDGREVTDSNWPEVVTIHPDIEKISSPLTIATAKNGVSYLYAASAGFDDLGPYHGHLTSINLADGSQNIFNSSCSLQTVYVTDITDSCPYIQSAIWGRAGVVYDPDADRIYFATGNGDFTVPNGGHSWGDSIIALNPDGSATNGLPLDSYTPVNFQELADNDNDIGSTSPTLLPAIQGSKYPHLAVQAGKDATLRLINLDDMSGNGGPGNLGGELQIAPVNLGGGILQAPATWVNPADGSAWLFVVNFGTISGWQVAVSATVPSLVMRWQVGPGGTSPVVNNGILYYASSYRLYALDPTTGHQLWSDAHIGDIHWESVLVVQNRLYITDEDGHLSAYTPSNGPTVAPAPTAVSDPNDTPNSHYFAETGHFVKGRFLTYWQENGDLPVFGFPISDAMGEVSDVDGKTYIVQYFQRAEFEYHPENAGTPNMVLLTLLGSINYQQQYADTPPAQEPSITDPLTFIQTGKTIGGQFRSYWEAHGGLATFGYPITDQFQEVSAADGKTYTVQYFERAEFEYHPENTAPFDVQPTQLGVIRYQQKYPGK